MAKRAKRLTRRQKIEMGIPKMGSLSMTKHNHEPVSDFEHVPETGLFEILNTDYGEFLGIPKGGAA